MNYDFITSETALSDLDSRIAVAELDNISKLKSLRNLLTSFLCRLPDELIVRIMQQHLPLGIKDTWDYEQLSRLPWKELQICSRIWGLAKNSPSLWSFVQLGYGNMETNTQWLELCKTRMAGHHVALEVLLDPAEEIAPVVKGLSSRTRELDLGGYCFGELRGWHISRKHEQLYCSLIMDTPWPVLQRAIVQSFEFTGSPGRLDQSLLPMATNTLTCLTLKLTWKLGTVDKLPNFPLLTYLKIHSLIVDHFTCLYTWFMRTTRLVSIDLEFERIENESDKVYPAQRDVIAPLSELRLLRLLGHPEQLVAALAILPDPRDELRLHCQISPGQDGSLQTPVIARALAYYQTHHDATSPCPYQLSLHFLRRPRFLLQPLIPSSSRSPSGQLEIEGEVVTQAIMEHFVGIASTVEFVTTDLIEQVAQVLSSSHSIVESLFFAKWDSYWHESPNVDIIQQHLELAKARGRSVKTISVDAPDSEDLRRLESRWQADGLTGEIVKSVKLWRFFSVGPKYSSLSRWRRS